MSFKIILFTTVVLTVRAQQYPCGYSTSQSLTSQDSPQTPRGQSYTGPIVHRPALFRRPFPLHNAPVYENVVEENMPAFFAPASTQQKNLPYVQNVAARTQYLGSETPLIRYATSHIAPTANYITPAQNNNYPVQQLQEYITSPEYKFKYSDHTSNVKYQQENGGVYGTEYYSSKTPVSSVRTVLYDSDNHSGFSATVEHLQPSTHVQPSHHSHSVY